MVSSPTVQQRAEVGCSSSALQHHLLPLPLTLAVLPPSSSGPLVVVLQQGVQACLARPLHRASQYCSISVQEEEHLRLVELVERPVGDS